MVVHGDPCFKGQRDLAYLITFCVMPTTLDRTLSILSYRLLRLLSCPLKENKCFENSESEQEVNNVMFNLWKSANLPKKCHDISGGR